MPTPHIAAEPGDFAEVVLLPGDPLRAEYIAEEFLDGARQVTGTRNMLGFTGTHEGTPVAVMGPGMGIPSASVYATELITEYGCRRLFRVGSCGGLQPKIALGDLVVSTGAVRLENTTSFFVPEGFPAVASFEVTQAIVDACRQAGSRYHVGITASAPGFYGAQSRHVPGFPPRFADLPGELGRLGVLNFEMEAATLLTMCSALGLRAGCVTGVVNRAGGDRIGEDELVRGEAAAIRVAVEAVQRLVFA